LLRLLYDLGPRPGEIATLCLSDLDLDHWRLRITRHKTEGKEQYLELTRETIIALQRYLKERQDRVEREPQAPLLVRTTRYGALVEHLPQEDGTFYTPCWSVRNLSRRVHDLGVRLTDERGAPLHIDLCAYNARHNWTREVFLAGNALPDILESGGWTSNSGVWRRYYGRTQVANAHIRLNRQAPSPWKEDV
jgi:integrase